MKRVAFHTLGCKVNQYETQAMTELFEGSGYHLVKDTEIADVYVINTCTVTNVGDKKSRQFIRRAKRNNPDGIIVVVGCYAQTAPEKVLDIEGVNIVIGTNERNKIVEIVEGCSADSKVNVVDDIMKIKKFEEMTVQEMHGKTRAFLKIQEGCNQYCAYCIIPYARGPIRSRGKIEIIQEVQTLVNNGFKEVVLTGIHVASYGKDLGDHEGLLDVLKRVNAIEGLERIRLSSLEPTLFSDAFLSALSKLEKICDHFHLSLQSGSDKTLKKMNRKYTSQMYRETVKRIRHYYPLVALTTDIIVGFPGETDVDFQTSYDFVEEMAFSEIHVFKYSPREGTPAAQFDDQIDGITKHERSEKLIELGDRLKKEYQLQFIDQRMEVLLEGQSGQDQNLLEGFTTNHLKVLLASKQGKEGMLQDVQIDKIMDSGLLGHLL
ncbi:RNA modification enzyme, MiaB family [Alkaliphilus metalliredigens QYMF]|uniref:Threonylcarbamoyladenosine tRNA methylthiotransferase MtaB n=1 Tax=Alkaliphilus metalliredigens (strain QYMF) TaxID=293826 RepID=A6TSL6_ALKMQ|nr:tRNA (N(6)-L-threonylcarbamoyladenosine(37)-C(2))-methylthiotransferase MtaB [Alkaliphilus metalliredigens]ABR49184.1 RNA modification enzyme, MiaB family [Alkaliphilus metalliredigens QYMF]